MLSQGNTPRMPFIALIKAILWYDKNTVLNELIKLFNKENILTCNIVSDFVNFYTDFEYFPWRINFNSRAFFIHSHLQRRWNYRLVHFPSVLDIQTIHSFLWCKWVVPIMSIPFPLSYVIKRFDKLKIHGLCRFGYPWFYIRIGWNKVPVWHKHGFWYWPIGCLKFYHSCFRRTYLSKHIRRFQCKQISSTHCKFEFFYV